jgi:hypothetical protein
LVVTGVVVDDVGGDAVVVVVEAGAEVVVEDFGAVVDVEVDEVDDVGTVSEPVPVLGGGLPT